MTLGDAAEPLVRIQNFRMNSGDTSAIKHLSFDIRAGETFMFLGSNRSAKITALRAGLFRYGSIEYGKKLSIEGTFRRKELAAKLTCSTPCP